MVWEAIQAQGYSLSLRGTSDKSVLLRGQHSVKAAVAAVAKVLKCSETTVWNAWSDFDALAYEIRREKCQDDFEWDNANQARYDEALADLQREFGNRADFPKEEVEERARELDDIHAQESAADWQAFEASADDDY
jgi:hypothetical protein